MFFTIIIFIAVLSLLVFVHEFGHFITARKFGIKVDEFGFGLPPRIFGLKRGMNGQWLWVWGNKNEPELYDKTVYSLNWILVGGFVKIKGENGEEAESPDSFGSKSIWKRCVILVAGVTMNVVLCVVLLSIGFGIGLPASVDFGQKLPGAIVSSPSVRVMEVLKGDPAETAGIKAGDTLLTVGDQKIEQIANLQQYLADKNGQQVKFVWQRAGKELNAEIVVKELNGKPGIGVALAELAIVRYPWYLAIWEGTKATYNWIIAIVLAFAMIIKNLVVGQPVGVEVAGPVGIAVMTGQAAKLGFTYLLQFAALLSLNLAIINILPFPALDGGRVLFLVIEKIRGKAIKQKWENMAHNIGFILLMALVLLVTFKDIVTYGSGLWQWFGHLFGK